jgi:glutathione synthase/RimK-type ligase-like ATP-grasp enzyme
MPIIICEEPDDELILRVRNLLSARGIQPQIIPTVEIATVGLNVNLASVGEPEAHLGDARLGGGSARIWWRRGTWPRRSYFAEPDDVVAEFMARQYAGAMKGVLSLATLNSGLWMNDPHREALLDENKILQHAVARRVGLTVPPTLCTDDPGTARRFAREHGRVAVKPVAGFIMKTRTPIGEVPLTLLTKRLTANEFDEVADMVRYAPVLLQPYVEKAFELRITIVAGSIFACRIDSQAAEMTEVDWRNYDLDNTPHSVIELDESLNTRLRAFMESAGLKFAAVDMIVTPGGEAVFLEANPCGQYGWIEDLTGLPISARIADWLSPTASAI